MGKVVTVMNMKGGVGKTTVALHLAGIAANYRHKGHEGIKRVLMIDYDPQFNLSQSYLQSKVYFDLESKGKTTLSILTDNDAVLNPFVLQVPGNHSPPKVEDISTVIQNFNDGGCLHLVPSTLDLMYVALGQTTAQLQPMEERFRKFIQQCKEKYDLIFIDCHPAGSIFTKTSLQNSDSVIIPVAPERYAARGIGLMLKFIAAKSAGNASPKPLILFNKTSRGKASAIEVSIKTTPQFAPLCLGTTMHLYKAFQEPEEGRGFVWKSKKPYSSEAFMNVYKLTREVLERIA